MNSIDNLNTGIAAAEAAIAKARPLADQLAAMQNAAASIATAAATLAQLRAQLAEAERTEQTRAASMSRYRVTSIKPGNSGRYNVSFIERSTGPYGPEARTLMHPLDGLSAELLAVVLADLNQVPAAVLALDADPEQAVRKHAQAVRRGYFVS